MTRKRQDDCNGYCFHADVEVAESCNSSSVPADLDAAMTPVRWLTERLDPAVDPRSRRSARIWKYQAP
jgi:hypothetical protein